MISTNKTLTRRTFMTTTALAAGALATASAAGCSSVSTDATDAADASSNLAATGEPVEETYAINFCRGNCGDTCPQRATVREGKLVKCVPVAAEAGREYRVSQSATGCVKGRSTPQRIYATHRVLHPMRRTGERGGDQWEEISWDEATALIAEKFQAAIDEFGGKSVAFWRGFGNSRGFLNGSAGVGLSRFSQKIGATMFEASSDEAAMYMTFYALQIPISGNEDLINAKTILNIGLNPADTSRGDWPIVEAQRAGAKVVTMDPVFSKSAAHSDIWVPVRPGTDGAMLLAMCNYIIDNDLIDYDYLRNHSVAPLLVKDDLTYLRLSDLGLDPLPAMVEGGDPVDSEVVYDAATQNFGSSFAVTDPELEGSFDANGIPVRTVYSVVKEAIKEFTVEFAAAECDVPAEQIEEVAKLYATNKPATLAPGYGYEHYKNSWHIYKTLMLLASLTGNNCKPGASVIQFGATSSLSAMAGVNRAAGVMEDGLSTISATGEYLPQILETGQWNGEEHPVRCVYFITADPLTNGLGRNELIEALSKVDFVVTADSFMTDTARYSDLVLPVALSWETDDATGFMFTQKAVEPLGECKTDIDIFRAIGDAMGFDGLYKTDEEYLREYLDTPENLEAGCGYDVMSEQALFGEPTFTAGVGAEYNATGRTQFFLEQLISRDTVAWTPRPQDHYPWYEPAYEAYQANPLREKYPLYGVSSHHHYWAHSLFKGVPLLDELRGEPTVLIHEETASARNIKTGDTVRVFNDHGYVVLKAVVNQGIRPDTLMLPHGPEGDDFIDGHTQALSTVSLDEMTSNNNFNDFVCEIEKYEGGAA